VEDIPIDADYDDGNDSAFDTESLLGSDTTSLSSSITKYRFENGRRYHAYHDGAYWGPNDEIHNDQQDIAHHLWLIALDNQLFLAPIHNPQRILDVGTGTGIWAIDVADRFPSASVIGTDLSAIQPQWVPPNCSFEIDDATLEWAYTKESFDFVHSREMFGSVSDWDKFYEQAYLHIKPGGYIESAERSVQPISDDDTVGPDHTYTKWGQTIAEMGERWGKPFTIYKYMKEKMEKAGFVDVVETKMKWPMTPWSKDPKMKEIGRWNQMRAEQGLEGYSLRLLTQVGGWSYEEVQVFIAKMRAALREKKSHPYIEVTIAYGRKPERADA